MNLVFGEGLQIRGLTPPSQKVLTGFPIRLSRMGRPYWSDGKMKIQAFPLFPCLNPSGTFQADHSPVLSLPRAEKQKGQIPPRIRPYSFGLPYSVTSVSVTSVSATSASGFNTPQSFL